MAVATGVTVDTHLAEASVMHARCIATNAIPADPVSVIVAPALKAILTTAYPCAQGCRRCAGEGADRCHECYFFYDHINFFG